MHFQTFKCTEYHLPLLGTLLILLTIVPGLVCVSNSGVVSSLFTSATITATYPQSLSPSSGNFSSSSQSRSSPSFSTASNSLTFFGFGNSSSHHVRGSMGTASPTVNSSPTAIGSFSLSTLHQRSTTPIWSYSSSSKTSQITSPSHGGILIANSSFSAGTSSTQSNSQITPSPSQTAASGHVSSSHDGGILKNASYLTNISYSATTSSHSEPANGQLQRNGRITQLVRQTTSILGRSSASSSPTKTSSSNSALVSGFYEILTGGTTTYFSITTTITSPPTGFATRLASNSQWSGDTNTVIDQTTYPVLYGCAYCGGSHHGIILVGLGGTSSDPTRTGCGSGILAVFRSIFGCGTEFNFPSIWDLPAFIIDPSGDPVPLEPESVPDQDSDPDPESSSDQKTVQTSQSRSDDPTLSRASSTLTSLAPTSLNPTSLNSTQSNSIPSTSIPSASIPSTSTPSTSISSASISSSSTSSTSISSALNSSSLTSSASNFSSSTSSASISSASASSVVNCSSSATPITHGVFLTVGMTSVELNNFSAFLIDEVGDAALVAQISTSMFAAVVNDCVASRIDTHTSVSAPPSKQEEIRLKRAGRDRSPRYRGTHRLW